MIDWTKVSSLDELEKQAAMTTTSQQFYNTDKPTRSHDGVQKLDTTDFATANKNLSGIEHQEDQQEPDGFVI
jgi:hypothetical protein